MKLKFTEHLLSTLVVAGLLLGLMFLTRRHEQKSAEAPSHIAPYAAWDFADMNDPFEKALFADLLDVYKPANSEENARIARDLSDYRHSQLMMSLQGGSSGQKLTAGLLGSLFWMYVKFFVVYVVVMGLTWYGVQTLAVWRFVREKRHALSQAAGGGTLQSKLFYLLGRAGAFAGSLILFSPSFIIAYSIRTKFNTDMILFVVVLAAISNGLLAMYATKFYAFLTAEARKGYVETAIVKNLNNDYGPGGVPAEAIFRLRKRFPGHVFGHIFGNAQYQYLGTLKEQAAFLITGLVIIEMALNIHGHLSYEMLKQLLYKNYDIVLAILLFIFFTVKLTEIFTDLLVYNAGRKISNLTDPKRGSAL